MEAERRRREAGVTQVARRRRGSIDNAAGDPAEAAGRGDPTSSAEGRKFPHAAGGVGKLPDAWGNNAAAGIEEGVTQHSMIGFTLRIATLRNICQTL